MVNKQEVLNPGTTLNLQDHLNNSPPYRVRFYMSSLLVQFFNDLVRIPCPNPRQSLEAL